MNVATPFDPCRLRWSIAVAIVGWFLAVGPIGSVLGEMKKSEQTQVNRLKLLIDAAGKAYKSGDFELASAKFKAAQKSLEKLLDDADADFLAGLRPQYNRLRRAHELLEEKGEELPELKAFPTESAEEASDARRARSDDADAADDISDDEVDDTVEGAQRAAAARRVPAPAAPAVDGTPSFTKDIAPLLVANCASCHIRQTKGELSMASYSSLMAGGESGESIVAGNANSSALFEMVRDKKMPPRRGLRPNELKLLQEWIDGGASFDGPDQAVELRSLVPAGARRTAGGAGSEQGGSAPEATLDRTTSRRR